MSQQTTLDAFINYCKTTDISEKEINDPEVFYQSIAVQALVAEMDKDAKFAETALVTMAKEFKKMPPYRACLSAFFIGLYGERGITSLYADRDLLDFFDISVKFIMMFITRMAKLTGVKQFSPEVIQGFFSQIDLDKMTQSNPELVELIKGMPRISTAVLSRISGSRAMRSYLRGTNVLAACAIIGSVMMPVRYVAAMLNITEQQQVLVLFPNSKIGFEITVEEVDCNFEVFSLLQIALAKNGYMDKLGLSGYRYDEQVDRLLSRNVKDAAELMQPVKDKAVFNYYTLHPVNKDRKNRYRMDTDYLCDGTEHIDALGSLDGRLILLADKCTVDYSWGNAAVTGMHPNLHPKLTIDRVLPKEEYEKWIELVEGIGSYHQQKDED